MLVNDKNTTLMYSSIYLSNLHNKFHFIKCHIIPLFSQFMIGFYNTFHDEITWINEDVILGIPFMLVSGG